MAIYNQRQTGCWRVVTYQKYSHYLCINHLLFFPDNYLFSDIWDLLLTDWVTKVKPDMNSIEVRSSTTESYQASSAWCVGGCWFTLAIYWNCTYMKPQTLLVQSCINSSSHWNRRFYLLKHFWDILVHRAIFGRWKGRMSLGAATKCH